MITTTRSISALLIATLVLWAAPAPAVEDPEPDAQSKDTVAWDEDWERFRWWEYAASTTLMAAGFVAQFILPAPDSGPSGGVLFDEALYEALAPQKQSVWDTHALVSDVTFYGSMGYRAADALIAGLAHDAWDVAWQMFMMDFESFSLIASSLWVPQYLGLGRERPIFTTCGESDRIGDECENNDIRYRSFYGGHPAVAMSAAGSTCVHHYFLPLYGGGAADVVACGAMLGVAAMTGVERVVAGKHWPTDVLVGWGIGAATGFLVPLSLHYGFDRDPEPTANQLKLSLVPVAYGGDHLGASLSGRF